MPTQNVNSVIVPVSVLNEVDLEYSVDVNTNKFVCYKETATKVLNKCLSSSDESS